jgi:hypothetical protein
MIKDPQFRKCFYFSAKVSNTRVRYYLMTGIASLNGDEIKEINSRFEEMNLNYAFRVGGGNRFYLYLLD